MFGHVFDFFRHRGLEFVGKTHEKDDIYTFSFRPSQPIKFIAGQHSLFILPGLGGAKPFSLASSPSEAYVKLGTRVGSNSRFKKALMAMKPGDNISMQGPYLNFIFPKDDKPAIMLAQGIGITPFRSMLLWAAEHQPDRLTVLIHVEGGSHTYRPETEKAASVARYVTNPVDFQTELDAAVAARPDAWLYVSGSPRFIRSTTKLLTERGIPPSRIKKDGFLGY